MLRASVLRILSGKSCRYALLAGRECHTRKQRLERSPFNGMPPFIERSRVPSDGLEEYYLFQKIKNSTVKPIPERHSF